MKNWGGTSVTVRLKQEYFGEGSKPHKLTRTKNTPFLLYVEVLITFTLQFTARVKTS